MNADSLTRDDAGKLLERCIGAFNEGVRTGDFSAFLENFTEDAVLDFEGIPDWGPFEGRDAITVRIERDPPDDEIKVMRWRYDRDRICAEFRWKDIPEARGGDMLIVPRDGLIQRLTIAFGGPATRWP
jgi:hypothetical protein